MPIYEYQCSSCQHQFELIQKISEQPVTQCPQCLKDSAKRLVSAAGFQLKGTGWYVTDFKDKAKAKPAEQKKKTAETTATSTSKKGESD